MGRHAAGGRDRPGHAPAADASRLHGSGRGSRRGPFRRACKEKVMIRGTDAADAHMHMTQNPVALAPMPQPPVRFLASADTPQPFVAEGAPDMMAPFAI